MTIMNVTLFAVIMFLIGLLFGKMKKMRNDKPLDIKIKYSKTHLDNNITKISEEDLKRGDWIDLRAAKDYKLKENSTAIIDLGVSMELPEGYEAIIAPRSSTFKKFKITSQNSIGIIDNAYCGNDDVWGFPVIAHEKTKIPKNARICQFRIIKNQEELKITEVENLKSKPRGGFGSTGTE